jgi:hypothetical protein
LASVRVPVSTTVQPAPSSSRKTFTVSSTLAIDMRAQNTPGATGVTVPGKGGRGRSAAAPPAGPGCAP